MPFGVPGQRQLAVGVRLGFGWVGVGEEKGNLGICWFFEVF